MQGLDAYTTKPILIKEAQENTKLTWSKPITESADLEIVSKIDSPFAQEGGMRMLHGALGTGIVKVSAVDPEYHLIEAPCKIFENQDDLKGAFDSGELDRDVVVVVRFQGPAANGMPELHKLTPYLGILQDKGFKVALVTDGRMSGASGKVLAAIHISPEAKKDGLLAYLVDGDVIRVDATSGELSVLLAEDELRQREPAQQPEQPNTIGRGLFEKMRNTVGESTDGAASISFATNLK